MRIYQLNLKCYNIKEMKEFYTDVLEMPLVVEAENYFAVMAGTTKLIFEKDLKIPYYHVCFRTNLTFYDHMFKKLTAENVLQADENGDFSLFWKGKQAYFTDPDGNILEMLERPFDGQGSREPTGWFDIGEIGLPVNDVKNMQKILGDYLDDEYKGKDETFAFYGDQKGVCVLVKEGRPWYPTNRGATIHPLRVFVSGERDMKYKDTDYPYEIIIRREWTHSLPVVQFRMSRPTNQLDKLVQFYEEGIGLEKIGEFRQHEGYDGIMLGLPNHQYHLEFTQSEEIMELPKPTKEHLLVFYMPNLFERDKIVERLARMGYHPTEPENPYWGRGGVTIEDPDGWRVVLMNTSGI